MLRVGHFQANNRMSPAGPRSAPMTGGNELKWWYLNQRAIVLDFKLKFKSI